jgi:hypothetical protein
MGFYPQLWHSTVQTYGLKERPAPATITAYGPGGKVQIRFAHIDELTIGSLVLKGVDIEYINDDQHRSDAGFYGRSLAGFKTGDTTVYDTEYDYAHNAVRIFKPDGCAGPDVVYWGGPYSEVDQIRNEFFGVNIGGRVLEGAFSSGDEASFITSEATRRLSVKVQPAGLLPMGMLVEVSVKPIEVSIATFDDVGVGDEHIKNAALAVGDVFSDNTSTFTGSHLQQEIIYRPEVVLGADFMRSHRIFVAPDQHKIYFSYEGGPVFANIYKRLGVTPPSPPRP